MGQIEVERTPLEGLLLIRPKVFGDCRGSFSETYNRRDLAEHGILTDFVQDNESRSVKGVLRGMHYQIRHPQTKLVRVSAGEVFDVVVDLRPGSATYGQWYGSVLSQENHCQLLIPHGFAHGFLVLSENAVFNYKVDDYYHPGDEAGIAWDDPAVGIKWPSLDGYPLTINERDQKWPPLSQIGSNATGH